MAVCKPSLLLLLPLFLSCGAAFVAPPSPRQQLLRQENILQRYSEVPTPVAKAAAAVAAFTTCGSIVPLSFAEAVGDGVPDVASVRDMSPHLDVPAAASFLVISVGWWLLRQRIQFAVQASNRRKKFEEPFRQAQIDGLTTSSGAQALREAEAQMALLLEEEERARLVRGPLGLTFRLLVPGDDRQVQQGGRTEAVPLSQDDSLSSTLQTAVIFFVVILLVWMLEILSADPMNLSDPSHIAHWGE